MHRLKRDGAFFLCHFSYKRLHRVKTNCVQWVLVLLGLGNMACFYYNRLVIILDDYFDEAFPGG